MLSHVVALVAILSLVASCTHCRVVIDDDAAAAAASAKRQCPYAAEGFTQYELFHILSNNQRVCMGDPGVVVQRLMVEAKTKTEIRDVMEEVCADAPEFRRCLSTVTEDARLCLDNDDEEEEEEEEEEDTAFELFLNVRDFIEAVVTTSCSNRSEGVTVLMHALSNLSNESTSDAEYCMSVLGTNRFNNATELTAEFSHMRYATVRGLKMCFVGVITRADDYRSSDVSDTVANFFDEIISKMTCISRETSKVGLCNNMYGKT